MTYDLTCEDTFLNLSNYLRIVKENAPKYARIYLIGTKSELDDQRKVTRERAIEMARFTLMHGVFDVSAKTGFNVQCLFV